jgi:hypothetical protein
MPSMPALVEAAPFGASVVEALSDEEDADPVASEPGAVTTETMVMVLEVTSTPSAPVPEAVTAVAAAVIAAPLADVMEVSLVLEVVESVVEVEASALEAAVALLLLLLLLLLLSPPLNMLNALLTHDRTVRSQALRSMLACFGSAGPLLVSLYRYARCLDFRRPRWIVWVYLRSPRYGSSRHRPSRKSMRSWQRSSYHPSCHRCCIGWPAYCSPCCPTGSTRQKKHQQGRRWQVCTSF